MNTNQKLLFITSILFFTNCVYSQRYAVTGGLNFANMAITGIDSIKAEELVFRTGIRFGMLAEYSFNDVFAVEPAAILSMKGYNYKTTFKNEPLARKVNLFYFDVPLHLKVTYEWGNYKIFGLIGPYGSVGLKGKAKTDYRGQSEQVPIFWGNDVKHSDFLRFDYGLSVGAGIEMDKASFRILYNRGFMNTSPRADAGEIKMHRDLVVSFAYFFTTYYHHYKYKF